MAQPTRRRFGQLVFLIGPKNVKLIEHVEILLFVKFRKISFSGYRGEVEKCFGQSDAGAAIFFFDHPEKHNLVENYYILLHFKFRWIPFGSFRGDVENVKGYPGWQTPDGRRMPDDGRTDDGQCAKAIAHLSLRLLVNSAKKGSDLIEK